MSFNFRVPNLTAPTPEGKLLQMHSFLYQTVEQLNWALNTLETGTGTGGTIGIAAAGGNNGNNGNTGSNDNIAKFNDIKALIIKSADIVNAYYEKISKKLSGEFVAQSDFGMFTELTEQQIKANSTAIDQYYTNLQQIVTDIEKEVSQIDVSANIRSGVLDYGADGTPVYGLEIGQRTEIDGVEVFNQFARFTAEKLSFYDSNGIEVAYISDKKLHITHVEVTVSFSLGGFVDTVLADRSVVTRWYEGGVG